MPNLAGVGAEAPTVTTEHGGKHSASPYAFHLVPRQALGREAIVLAEGAKKYGNDNWRGISVEDNLNHALQHIFAFLEGDDQERSLEEHLAHAACRVHFALENAITGVVEQKKVPVPIIFGEALADFAPRIGINSVDDEEPDLTTAYMVGYENGKAAVRQKQVSER